MDLLLSGVAVFVFTRVVRGEWFMLFFLLVFGVLGLLMAIPVISGWGAYHLNLLPGAIDVRRSIGPLAWSRRLDAGRIAVVDSKVCASTSGGRKWFEVFCRLDAEDTRTKRRYTLAVNIAGDLGARWLKRRIEEHVARPAVSTRVQAETR